MPKWPPRLKSMEERKFSYMHYGVLLFAQGTWNDKDRKKVHEMLSSHPKSQSDELYLFQGAYPSNCKICNQIYELFSEILGKNDGMMFYTHDIWLEISGMKLLTELVFKSEEVKKFYIFQGGPIERSAMSKGKFIRMKLIEEIILKERLKPQKVTKKEFLEILDTDRFEEEILYEVVRAWG
jgi:hypothetical protein